MTDTAAPTFINTEAHDTVAHTRCAALEWDALLCRWYGTLYLPAGKLAAYISTNPHFNEPNQPRLFICSLADNERVGCLWPSNKAGYIGRLNTVKPLALFAIENVPAGRFIIRRRQFWIKPPLNPVTLNLMPYAEGDGYHP